MKIPNIPLPERNSKCTDGTMSRLLGGLLIVIFICAFAVPGVSADETLSATITVSSTTPMVGDEVTFSGSSTASNITSWAWDFDDGNSETGQSQTHTYEDEGSFTVTLTVSDAAGATGTTTESITVAEVTVPPVASFTFLPASPKVGDSVTFTDTSTGDVADWTWDFGDDTTSNEQSPSHQYSTAQSYTVTLTVSDGESQTNSATQSFIVAAAAAVPVASFDYSPTTPAPGEQVTFTDQSSNSPTLWNWYFDDGGTSIEQNPLHTFTSEGTYTVSLSATNVGGTSNTYTSIITVSDQSLDADFDYSPSSPDAGESITFTDESDGEPTSWDWDFDDGVTSIAQTPTHSYSSDGEYDVTLTIEDDDGDSDDVTITITVGEGTTTLTGEKPDAAFTWTPTSPVVGSPVSFTDTSTGDGISEWKWEFEDPMDFTGNRESTLRNPQHTYQNAGSYDVTLFVKNSGGSDIILKTITVGTVRLNAKFSASPSSGTAPLTVRFVDSSTGVGIESWQWDFGNGQTYDGESPSNIVYSSSGSYTASLEVTDENGDTDEYTTTITVKSPAVATVAQTAAPTATPVPVAEESGLIDGEYRQMTGLYNEYIRIIFGFLGVDDEPDFLIIAVDNSQS
ncbi:PKD domain-containing protein [Methanogenium marinum]|uniref:PKD domain-containing protein n=1 Tax=Methanogenium marinum TaxID=348610 RepID=A0A9Q4PW89_9EURY|nr:PKD domain-containing protein [Methanogenium marinum]MDE4908394.1 PKD domain-containing protein [Methanogenium marinum]